MRRGRGPSSCAAALAIGAAALGGGSGVATPARAAVPVVVLDGRGFGHGVGMAQDGALWMGARGAGTGDILGHFYPGTGVASAGGEVRVAILDATSGFADVEFPAGGEVRDAPEGPQSAGFPLRVAPGGRVRLSVDAGGYHAQPGGADPAPAHADSARPGARLATGAAAGTRPSSTAAPTTATTTSVRVPKPAGGPAPTLVPPVAPEPTTATTRPARRGAGTTGTTTTTSTTTAGSGAAPPHDGAPGPDGAAVSSGRPLWAVTDRATVSVPARGRRYRGAVEALAGGGPGPDLRLLDVVDVEQYLRGMGEVLDPSWPAASLRAQAIASRTYALRAMASSGELCDDDHCQVYLGQQAEYPEMDRAVADTRGQVLEFGSGLASTVFSSNGGGISATTEEGFGTDSAGYPYLRAAPYETRDVDSWSVTVALSDVASRFGYPGTLTDVKVSRTGPSGRALLVDLVGSAGTQSVPALAWAAGLGLRSTLFTARLASSETAPSAPAPAALIQLPPDQLGTLGAAVAGPGGPGGPGPSLAPGTSEPAGILGAAPANPGLARSRALRARPAGTSRSRRGAALVALVALLAAALTTLGAARAGAGA
ncbi:MAG: SpoIID/LytB domain-containing protein [Acidimicrobiales bacterium]